MKPNLIVRQLGLKDYQTVWQDMRDFTDQRTAETPDELWLVEHRPVYTLGQNGKPEHILNAHNIPIIQTDRGGQVTYHGPGQLVAYPLLELRRRNLGVRPLVTALENTIIATLNDYNIKGVAKCDAPGVYVDDAKIASIGLRIRKGCSYHGIAFNINMDLIPFQWINPCGFSNLKIVQCHELGGPKEIEAITPNFLKHFCEILGYNAVL